MIYPTKLYRNNVFYVRPRRSWTHYLQLILLLSYVTSCSGGSNIEPASFNLSEAATHELRELFRVNEPAEGVFFTRVDRIHLLSDGHIIIQNGTNPPLYELDMDGKLVNTIGRKGRGPGELLNIHYSLATAGDTLHLFDRSSQRQQVWARTGEGGWMPARERTVKNQAFFQHIPLVPEEVISGPDQQWFGLFRIRPSPVPMDTVTNFYDYVARIDYNLEQVDKVEELTEIPRLKREQELNMAEGGYSWDPRFFHGFYQYDPVGDKVIYVTNTSNEIIGIDASGTDSVLGYLPFDRFPRGKQVEQEVRDQFYSIPKEIRQQGGDIEEKIEEKLDRMLEHEPYYWNLILNGDELWVHLVRSDEGPDWVVTTLQGEVLKSFFGPRFLRLNSIYGVVIRGNRIYGRFRDSDGEYSLAGYELVELDE